MIPRLIYFFALFLIWTKPAFSYEFGADLFQSISCTSERILARYPPNGYVVVGLGRSPTPLTTYLKTNYHSASSWNLPFSYRASPFGERTPLNDEDKEALFQHFDSYFPKDSELKGRKVVLMDYCNTAGSLKAADSYLQEYLRQRKRSTLIQPLCLAGERLGSLVKNSFKKADFLFTDQGGQKGNLEGELHKEKFDGYAEYESFDIELSGNEVIKNNDHSEFEKGMAAANKKYESIILQCKKAAAASKTPEAYSEMLQNVSMATSPLKMNPPLLDSPACLK